MNLTEPLLVKANDPVASYYGAFGKFTQVNKVSLSDIESVMITGVGSSFITDGPYGLPTGKVEEFEAIGLGGLYLSGLERAVVVSMGTGTATVMADKEKRVYLGGTGVGGGTLVGLSNKMLGMRDINHISELAMGGDLSKVDLCIKDICDTDINPTLKASTTAANFGKLSDTATNADIALGIINLVFETIGMVSIFAARNFKIRDIVLTGNLSGVDQAPDIFSTLNRMFDMNFIIPENSRFGTVIGAALAGCKDC
jgi:type II pantothenate kinase